MARAGSSPSQEPRIPTHYSTWAAQSQVLGPSSTAFIGELTGRWITVEQAGLELMWNIIWDTGIAGSVLALAHYTITPARGKHFK